VQIASRLARRGVTGELPPAQEIEIVGLAAASHKDRDQWAKFLGGWIEELVFDLEDTAASGAISVRVNSFLLIATVLRTYLNKSQSALESLNV